MLYCMFKPATTAAFIALNGIARSVWRLYGVVRRENTTQETGTGPCIGRLQLGDLHTHGLAPSRKHYNG